MIVASTIVPVATLQSLGRLVPLYLVEQRPAQILRLQQVAEAAHRGLVGNRLAAEGTARNCGPTPTLMALPLEKP